MASYTSNSEFDLETRVQITNEIPISRDYDAMHHSLRNDTWKWLIGTEDVEYNLPYGGDEVNDPPVKIVNGVEAKEFGSKPYKKWNSKTNSYDDINPRGTRLKIDGVLASEHDLFLHEIYRYLSCLYPDNQEWTKLLTRNEIIDAINSAAAIIDYKPNNEFFNMVAESLETDEKDVEDFKLNLRNLTSISARRKLYGSILGYRMLGHGVYENVITFPVDEVLPLQIEDKTSKRSLENYIVDTYDERYKTLFRRIDFLGNNRDVSFVQTNGYTIDSYSLPFFEEISFEFASAEDGKYTANDYKLYSDSGYSFYEKDRSGSIVEILSFDVLEHNLISSGDEKFLSIVSSDDKIYGVRTSEDSTTVYSALYKYKSYEELFSLLEKYNVKPGFVYNYINTAQPYDVNGKVSQFASNRWFYEFASKLPIYISDVDPLSFLREPVQYLYNPFVKNTFILPTEEMLKMYRDSVSYDEYEDIIPVGYDPDISKLPINKGDLVTFQNFENQGGSVYEITGASYGVIEMSIENTRSFSDYARIRAYEPFNTTNSAYQSNDSYGVVITNTDGEKVVLEGSLRFTWVYKTENLITTPVPVAATFYIKAIPEKLPDFMYRYLYGEDYDKFVQDVTKDISKAKIDVENARKILVQNTGEENVKFYDGHKDTLEKYGDESKKINDEIDRLTMLEVIDRETRNKIEELRNQLKEIDLKIKEHNEQYDKVVEDIKTKTEDDFNNYVDAIEILDGHVNDLDFAKDEHEKELENKSKIVENDVTKIRRECEVQFVAIGKTSISQVSCILDTGTIEKISFGNISVEPVIVENSKPVFFDYENMKISFAKLEPTIVRDSTYHQLYSRMLDDDIQNIFKATDTIRIFNQESYDVPIQVYIDKNGIEKTYDIQFLSDDAKRKFDSVTVGSSIYGPGIPANTYVTSLSNYSATVNNPLPKKGQFVLTFKCPVTTTPESVLDDMFNYKKIMYERNSYDKVTFFDKGLYGSQEWPNVSEAVLLGDLNDKQILNGGSFLNVVSSLYFNKLNEYNRKKLSQNLEETGLIIPSIDKNTKRTFVDINIKKLISNVRNYFGDTESLMHSSWIDYIENQYEDISLAKENVNFGANLTLETDTSGYASLVEKAIYTDPNLHLLFQTFNWSNETIPAYVQIGTGGSNMKRLFKIASEIMYPNVYGATFFDKKTETMMNEKGEVINDLTFGDESVEIRKRNTYATVKELNNEDDNIINYKSIDKPLFEVPLNEYNINLRTWQNNAAYTTIDILFYEQTFKNITKKIEISTTTNNYLTLNLINDDEYIQLNSDDSNVEFNENYVYYYFADGSDNVNKTGDLKIYRKINGRNFIENYEIICGGNIGNIPFYVNGNRSYRVHNPFIAEITEATAEYIANLTDYSKKLEFATAILTLKALSVSGGELYGEASGYLTRIVNKIASKNENILSEIPNLISTYANLFKNKLFLFTYFIGLFEKEEKDSIFGFKNFDLIGLIWDEKSQNLKSVRVNKNYILCTTDIIKMPPNIILAEYNLFYGYHQYDLITAETYNLINSGEGIGNIKSFNDVIRYQQPFMDSSNSILNYYKAVTNTIQLPRKFITEGSYDINLIIDPQFVAKGYLYDNYIKNNKNNTVEYYISQSAIKYDEVNDLFYTYSNKVEDEVGTKPSKIVIDFAEHKYFKNLKWLYGEYSTRLSQDNETLEAFITGIQGINFDASDLSTADKIVYAEEVNLRSPYLASLNNVLFTSVHSFEGEILGITKGGNLLVSGKRNLTSRRLYDSNLITTLNDISPAALSGTSLVQNVDSNINFSALGLDNPRFIDFDIKRTTKESFSNEDAPEFIYYKNLLLFEGLVNLVSPNIIEPPNSDEGSFMNVLDVINSGDTIVSALAINGAGESIHTITTNVQARGKALSVYDDKLMLVTADNKIYSAENVAFETVNNVIMKEEKMTMDQDGTLIDMMFDKHLNSWVVTLGLEQDKGKDFYGGDYYTFTKTITLNENGNSPAYANEFFQGGDASFSTSTPSIGTDINIGLEINDSQISQVGDIKFENKGPDNKIKIAKTEKAFEIEDAGNKIFVKPEDIAFYSYLSTRVDDKIVTSVKEGPYIVDPDEYAQAGKKMFQKIFTDNDISLVLQQDYMFVYGKSYVTDENGNYTTQLTIENHWKAAKIPNTLDYTMMSLKAHPVRGVNSAYNVVKQDIDNFAEWAPGTIQANEDDTGYIFTDVTLEDPQKKEDIDIFINAIKKVQLTLMTYDSFVNSAKYYVNDVYQSNITFDNYGTYEQAISKVVFDTQLPLNENLKVDTNKSYSLECTMSNGIMTESSPRENFVRFEEAYYTYLFYALAYVRGSREYDTCGAKLVKDIYSYNGKLYFRLVTGDLLTLPKNCLYKASDIENSENWDSSIMPPMSYLKMWKTEDLKHIGGYDTVELANGAKIAVNNREYNGYFFRITSDLFICPDGKHMFFGGYSIPLSTIADAYQTASDGDAFDTNQEWIRNLVNSWLNDDTAFSPDKKGKLKPFIMYSNDGGVTFEALPVKGYIDDDIFTDGSDYKVKYFTYDANYGKVIGFVDKDNRGYTTRQIIIDFDYTGNVDVTATQYTQLSMSVDGEIKTFNVDEGIITWSTGDLGFGTDIDSSSVNGSNTFNFDFTGNNVITIPIDLKVSRVIEGRAIRLNKPVTDAAMNGKYRVLFAVNTQNDIPIQTDYLSKDDDVIKDYVTDGGVFKVRTQQRVNNSSTANKIYMSRYFVENDTNNIGYPTVAEDVEKVYYEYDDKGNVIPLTNDFGNKVLICSEAGNTIKLKNDNDDLVSATDEILGRIDQNNLEIAGKYKFTVRQLINDTETMLPDNTMKNLLENNGSLSIRWYDFDNLLVTISHNSLMSDILSRYGCTEPLSENDIDWRERIFDFVLDNEDLWMEMDSVDDRFVYEDGYLFDKRFNVYMLKDQRYISGNLHIPYTFWNGGTGATISPNAELTYNNKNRLDGMYTGIYYHPMGYGGFRNYTMRESAPWIRDPAAFEDELLKNSFDDYVYVVDSRGNKAKIYDAIQVADGNEQITYDSFLNDGHNEIQVGDIIKKYEKLPRTKIMQHHSQSAVNQNSTVIMRFFKNAYQIENMSIVIDEDGDSYLYNEKNEKAYNVIFDETSKILTVGDKLVNEPPTKLHTQFKVSYPAYNDEIMEEIVDVEFGMKNVNNVVKVSQANEQTIIYIPNDDGGHNLYVKEDDNFETNEYIRFSFTYVVNENLSGDSFGYVSKSTPVNIMLNNQTLSVSGTCSIHEVEDITITYSGTNIIRLPIVALKDKFVVKNGTTYLGDLKSNIPFAAPLSLLSDDITVMELGYFNYIGAGIGEIIKGVYGYSISKKPKYSNFQNLISNEGFIISSLKSNDEFTKLSIYEIAEDNSEVKLSKPLNGDSFNSRYFLLKILTVSNQRVAVEHMNDKNYFVEISPSEIETYPPNRVWFNPNSGLLPPITVGQKVFNEENSGNYYVEPFRNGLSLPIYICDENGRYVNYDEFGNEYKLDPNNDGDCSQYIYTGVDSRYISPKPQYESCKEWFKNKMYSPNKEINPLWQIVNIKSNVKNKKWVQSTSLNRYAKSNNTQLLSRNVEKSYVEIRNLNMISAINNFLAFSVREKSFDIDTGEINLFFTKGDDAFNEDVNMSMYGLSFETKALNLKNKLKATLQMSYTVNSLRDISIKNNKNAALARITEMGIFDINHNMIAYAQFPPIEYRTDSQHLSFLSVIYHGSMIEY